MTEIHLNFDSKVITSTLHQYMTNGADSVKPIKSFLFSADKELTKALLAIGIVAVDMAEFREIVCAAQSNNMFCDALKVAVRGGVWWDWYTNSPAAADLFLKIMGLDPTKVDIYTLDCRPLKDNLIIWSILIHAGICYADTCTPHVILSEVHKCSGEVNQWWRDLSAANIAESQ